MNVTVSQYRAATKDGNGNLIACASEKITSEQRTTDGSFAALSDECRFIRIATDTKIHMDFTGAVTAADDLLPANTVELFGAHEGAVVSILTAV
jgi:hypothetical protein